MHPNEALIRRFYTAFGARDAGAMAACYHPDVLFCDPVFGELEGAEVAA
jgi:ketosteroid isomerase-like protein